MLPTKQTVFIVTIEWRNWQRDVFVFATRKKAEACVFTAFEVSTMDEAAEVPENEGHSFYIDAREVQ